VKLSPPQGFSAGVPLGGGGQARTWLAWQDVPGRWVVVKTDPRDPHELRAEAELLERLPGAPVPALLDKNLESTRPWIAMSWIDGVPLDDLPSDLDTTERLALLSSSARTVASLHTRGVVHGDLSMANLLAIPTGEVLAIDLGMASIGDLPLQGTWETLSPERLAGRPATPASDVFALGVLCLRLLGRLPEAWIATREEWTSAVLEEGLSSLASDLPAVARAVDLNPQCRPTALELSGSLGSRPQDWPREGLRRHAWSRLENLLTQAIRQAEASAAWSDAWRWQRERLERSDDPEVLLPDLGKYARLRTSSRRPPTVWILLGSVLLALAAAIVLIVRPHDRTSDASLRAAPRNPGWEDPSHPFGPTAVESFPLPSLPPGASLRVDGLPTDMPTGGRLLLGTGRHRIQLRDAVGLLILDTVWLGEVHASPALPPNHEDPR
jgi:serine/threonine protein kinase